MRKLIEITRRDAIAAGIAFVLIGLLFGYARWDVAAKRVGLEARAAEHAAEFLNGKEDTPFDHLVEVDSDKSFTLFGKDWGVVRLYMRQKDDTAMDTFIGIEHFYEYTDGQWKMVDQARIDLPEYIYEGYTKFRNAGFQVDDAAYQRYNR